MDETLTTSNTERGRQRTLNEEAAAWLLTLENELSAETEARFRSWLETSALHMQTFLEMTAIDRDLAGMDSDRQIDVEELIAAIRAEEAPNIVTLSARAVRPVQARRPTATLAASVVAMGVLGSLVLWLWHSSHADYATALGEQRAVKLEDGSLVHLNTLTHIEVHFSSKSRAVKLIEGEALFAVERDNTRPFRVITNSAVVQAVGTEFDVYRHAQSTTVSVVEGKVKISGAGDPVMLSAGESADTQRDGRVVRQAQGRIARAISWRQRQLSFDHDSLGYVAEQFNRYNRLQIRIVDPELSQRELEGVFNADQPQALLDFLAMEKDLRFERTDDTVNIHLVR